MSNSARGFKAALDICVSSAGFESAGPPPFVDLRNCVNPQLSLGLTELLQPEADPLQANPADSSIRRQGFPCLTCLTLTTIIVVNMTEKISTLEVRQRLGDILNRVALRNDQFIIERKGKPLAAVVPVERLEQMRRAAQMHLLQVLERQAGKPSEAQAERIADEAKHRTRKARRR